MTDLSVRRKLEAKLKLKQFESYSDSLCHYLALLVKWNKAYNLTAIRDMDVMVDKHVIDSLAISPWLKGSHILDVGTGAGLPGIPLALTHPQLTFVLIDSNGKKIRFLQELKRHLPLNNVTLLQTRVENYHSAHGFDTVISRAFSNLEQMTRWTHHLLADNGIWLAMKGHYPQDELLLLDYPYTVNPYGIEGMDGERNCIIIKNVTKERSWRKS